MRLLKNSKRNRSSLQSAFAWDETEQGHQWWQEQYYEMTNEGIDALNGMIGFIETTFVSYDESVIAIPLSVPLTVMADTDGVKIHSPADDIVVYNLHGFLNSINLIGQYRGGRLMRINRKKLSHHYRYHFDKLIPMDELPATIIFSTDTIYVNGVVCDDKFVDELKALT
ncbi:MAG: hypothetical protein WC284_09250 [Candidimonas sp.]